MHVFFLGPGLGCQGCKEMATAYAAASHSEDVSRCGLQNPKPQDLPYPNGPCWSYLQTLGPNVGIICMLGSLLLHISHERVMSQ